MFDSKSENRDKEVEAVESVPEVRVRVRVRSQAEGYVIRDTGSGLTQSHPPHMIQGAG